MIPAEAVEAAARVVYHTSGRSRQMPYSAALEGCTAEAKRILEAAAPHMLAGAWQEGHGAGWNDCLLDLENNGAKTSPNPYRSTP